MLNQFIGNTAAKRKKTQKTNNLLAILRKRLE